MEADGPDLRDYIINYVRPDSPAEQSGLNVGDVVLSINGNPTKDMKLSEVFNFLGGKNGKNMKLKIKRGDEIYYFKFKLRRYI